MTTLKERIERKDIIIMDGGVSTEIQRQGVAMDAGAWSGVAHKTHPDAVRKVHEDYIRAGADVITTNTFGTARHVLETIGLADEVPAINQQAVQLVREACDRAAQDQVWIAGSMSSMPSLKQMGCSARGSGVADSYREQAEILAKSGVDVIVAEMMIDPINAPLVMQAATSTGLPVWIGFSAALANGDSKVISWRTPTEFTAMPADDFGELVDAIIQIGGDVAGVMHSQLPAMAPALDVLSQHWTGPKLAYAETGRFENPDWNFVQVVSAEDYADEAGRWVNQQGVQIVGGCCGTGPEHIRVLKERLPTQLSS